MSTPDLTGWTQELSRGTDRPVYVSPDGLTVYSSERCRTYRRRFNHATAREWHALGFTFGEIAKTLGVSMSAIEQVIHPEIVKQNAARAYENSHTACARCGGPTMNADSPHRRVHRDEPLCIYCSNAARRTGIRWMPTGECEVWCFACKSWKAADDFAGGARYRDAREKGFANGCSTCQTAARQRYRASRLVPCEGGCGRLVEGKGRANSRSGKKPGERIWLDPNRPYYCNACGIAAYQRTRSHAA